MVGILNKVLCRSREMMAVGVEIEFLEFCVNLYYNSTNANRKERYIIFPCLHFGD